MILDSGERTEYNTGAVRDLKEGKGRFDLMPLDVVAEYLEDSVIYHISRYKASGDVTELYEALRIFIDDAYRSDSYRAMREVAKHFEDGCNKYGADNWRKGIPENSYIDSAVRHYCKWMSGMTDEPHDRAFVWNILCLAWTSRKGVK